MKRTGNVYVKAFRITNSENTFTEEDFILLQEKFKVIRKLYWRGEVNRDCYINFRTITKEIKRAAHNAGLKADLLKVDYACLSPNEISISGAGVNGINLLVFIKPVPELKGENFTVVKLEMLSDKEDMVLNIKYSDDYSAKYSYRDGKICVL